MTTRKKLPALTFARGAVAALVPLLLAAYLITANLFEDQSRKDEFRGVIGAASKYAAESRASEGPHCIRLDATRIAFKRWRSRKAGGELELGMANPEDYAWEEVTPEQAAARAEMKTALARSISQDQKQQLRSVPADWVDRRLIVVPDDRGARRCPVHILSEPTIAGNWAFIEDDIVCGPQCAQGKTLALRLVNKRWVVAWEAATWHVGFDRLLREPLPPPDSSEIVDL